MVDTLSLPGSFHKITATAPKLLCFLLVILIGITAAKLVWSIVNHSQNDSQVAVIPEEPPKLLAPAPPKPDYGAQIARLRVMGKPEKSAKAQVVQVQAKDAPDTSLNLTLSGVMALGDGEGFAIIEDQTRKHKFYQIDDEIISGTTLSAVFPDYVLLNRSGRNEKLRLPRADTADFVSAASRPTVDNNLVKTGANFRDQLRPGVLDKENDISLGNLRRQLTKNPSALANFVQIAPETDATSGQFKGFRVNPNDNAPDLFFDLGLIENDVVVAVNNIKLDSPNKGAQVFRQLIDANELQMTVLREGTEINLLHAVE